MFVNIYILYSYIALPLRNALKKKDYTRLADLMKENFSTRRYLNVITIAAMINIYACTYH